MAAPPAALSADCSDPVNLPVGALSAGAVERAWGADVVALLDCGERHASLRDFYVLRDKGLAGK